MRTFLMITAVLAATGFAPAPQPKPSKVPDMPALAGSWKMTRYQTGRIDSLGNREMRVTIEKDVWTFYIRDQGRPERTSSKYVMKVDPKSKPPFFTWHNNESKSLQYAGTYTFERDTLSIVFSAARGEVSKTRPTDFDNPRDHDYLIVMKRQASAP